MTRGYPGVLAEHGTYARYKADCHCAPCRKANARRQNLHLLDPNLRVVYGTGTVRRLRALAALGWSLADVGARMSWSKAAVSYLRGRDRKVLRSTAELVAQIYDELSMSLPSPSTPTERADVSRTRLHAARAGWAPPLAWDDIDDPAELPDLGAEPDPDAVDPVLIDRLLSGNRVEVPRDERPAIVRALAQRGLSDPRIGHLLYANPMTVLRDRQEHEIESRWAS